MIILKGTIMIINENSIIKKSNSVLRKSMYLAFNKKCFYTGRFLLFKDIQIDHIKPCADGGENCISNYVLSSKYINLKKHNTTSKEFVERIVAINKLIFVPDVIKYYNSIFYENNILISNITISDFMKKIGYYNHPNYINFRGYARHKLNYIKKNVRKLNGEISTVNRNYYNKKELKILFNKYFGLEKQNLINKTGQGLPVESVETV